MRHVKLLLLVGAQVAFMACATESQQLAKTAAIHESQAENFRMYISSARHVLLVSVTEETIERRRPDFNIVHMKATVVRSYKGSWKLGDIVRFNVAKEGVIHEFSSSDTINPHPSPEFILFLEQHSESEVALDTGLYWRYESTLEPLLLEISR